MPPRKLRSYLAAVKKMTPSQALDFLFYGRQKATDVLYQAVKSAVTNAKATLKVESDLLKFKVFTIEEGQKLKRYRPGGRGTPKPVVKRKSHIKIIIVSNVKKPELKTGLKEEAKKEEKKVEKKLEVTKKTAVAKAKAVKEK